MASVESVSIVDDSTGEAAETVLPGGSYHVDVEVDAGGGFHGELVVLAGPLPVSVYGYTVVYRGRLDLGPGRYTVSIPMGGYRLMVPPGDYGCIEVRAELRGGGGVEDYSSTVVYVPREYVRVVAASIAEPALDAVKSVIEGVYRSRLGEGWTCGGYTVARPNPLVVVADYYMVYRGPPPSRPGMSARSGQVVLGIAEAVLMAIAVIMAVALVARYAVRFIEALERMEEVRARADAVEKAEEEAGRVWEKVYRDCMKEAGDPRSCSDLASRAAREAAEAAKTYASITVTPPPQSTQGSSALYLAAGAGLGAAAVLAYIYKSRAAGTHG